MNEHESKLTVTLPPDVSKDIEHLTENVIEEALSTVEGATTDTIDKILSITRLTRLMDDLGVAERNPLTHIFDSQQRVQDWAALQQYVSSLYQDIWVDAQRQLAVKLLGLAHDELSGEPEPGMAAPPLVVKYGSWTQGGGFGADVDKVTRALQAHLECLAFGLSDDEEAQGLADDAEFNQGLKDHRESHPLPEAPPYVAGPPVPDVYDPKAAEAAEAAIVEEALAFDKRERVPSKSDGLEAFERGVDEGMTDVADTIKRSRLDHPMWQATQAEDPPCTSEAFYAPQNLGAPCAPAAPDIVPLQYEGTPGRYQFSIYSACRQTMNAIDHAGLHEALGKFDRAIYKACIDFPIHVNRAEHMKAVLAICIRAYEQLSVDAPFWIVEFKQELEAEPG